MTIGVSKSIQSTCTLICAGLSLARLAPLLAQPAVWHAGPEYQLLDNAAHQDGLTPETSAGADYALHAPSRDATRPVGEWNQGRLVVNGTHVEHWLNGEKVVEYEIESEDWAARVAASKFAEFANFGRVRRGRIAIQDHGNEVAFRNVKIRPL